MSKHGERAVVSDNGDRIVLAIYAMHSAATLAEVEIAPAIAVRLAGELAQAASAHLSRGCINETIPGLVDLPNDGLEDMLDAEAARK